MSYGINNNYFSRNFIQNGDESTMIPRRAGKHRKGRLCGHRHGRLGKRFNPAGRLPQGQSPIGTPAQQPQFAQNALMSQLTSMMQGFSNLMSQMMNLMSSFMPQGMQSLLNPMASQFPGANSSIPNAFQNGSNIPQGGLPGSPSGIDQSFGSNPLSQSADVNPGKFLETTTNDKGNVEIMTKDGYKISTAGERQEWTITSPDGKTTKIWGDPHVVESDGDKWDFKNQTTLQFGNNKITIETTPWGNGDQTVTSKIHVYSGNERVTVSGIDKNKPEITSAMSDAFYHDLQTNDGDVYYLSSEFGTGEDAWRRLDNNQELFQG